MILKKYIDFINESELQDHKIVILKLNDYLMDKIHSQAGFGVYGKDTIKNMGIHNKDHTVFLAASYSKDKNLDPEKIKKILDLPFDIQVVQYDKNKEGRYDRYIISYNLDEMLASNLGKSLSAFTKFNL